MSFFLPRGVSSSPDRRKEDDEIGFIGMADEMLGAVDDEIIAVLHGEAFHAAHVGARARLGHGKAIRFLAAHGGEEIFLALLALAGHQDIGRPRHAVPMQRVVGAAQLLLIEDPGQRIETGAAGFGRHVGGIEAGCDRLGLDLLAQIRAQHAGVFDLGFMRIELVLDEIARRLDDHVLFFGESEIHERQLPDVHGFEVAIDGDGLAVHHLGGGRSEEEAHIGDLFRLDKARDRLGPDISLAMTSKATPRFRLPPAITRLMRGRRGPRRGRWHCSAHHGDRVRWRAIW